MKITLSILGWPEPNLTKMNNKYIYFINRKKKPIYVGICDINKNDIVKIRTFNQWNFFISYLNDKNILAFKYDKTEKQYNNTVKIYDINLNQKNEIEFPYQFKPKLLQINNDIYYANLKGIYKNKKLWYRFKEEALNFSLYRKNDKVIPIYIDYSHNIHYKNKVIKTDIESYIDIEMFKVINNYLYVLTTDKTYIYKITNNDLKLKIKDEFVLMDPYVYGGNIYGHSYIAGEYSLYKLKYNGEDKLDYKTNYEYIGEGVKYYKNKYTKLVIFPSKLIINNKIYFTPEDLRFYDYILNNKNLIFNYNNYLIFYTGGKFLKLKISSKYNEVLKIKLKKWINENNFEIYLLLKDRLELLKKRNKNFYINVINKLEIKEN